MGKRISVPCFKSRGDSHTAICRNIHCPARGIAADPLALLAFLNDARVVRSEEHTSELPSLMRISYAVFCLKKKKQNYLDINISTALSTDINHTSNLYYYVLY